MSEDGDSILSRIHPRPLHGIEELPEISRLYDLTGWGPVGLDDLESWFFRGRHGSALIMVLADNDSDRIMGMTAFLPRLVHILDTQEIAARAGSAILDPALRRKATGQTVIDDTDPLRLLTRGSREHRLARGWRINYSLPNPLFRKRNAGSSPDTTVLRSRAELGPGVRLDLDEPNDGARMPTTISVVEPGSVLGEEYDDLWLAARENLGFSCAVVRDAQSVRPAQNRLLLEFRHERTQALRGYMTFQTSVEGRLEDLLATDAEAFDEMLTQGVAWLHANQSRHSMKFFNSLAHPVFKESLLRAGAYENDYLFQLSVVCIDGKAGPHSEASNWYVTMGD